MSTPVKDNPLAYALVPLALILAAALIVQGWHGSRATAILRTPPRKITLGQSPLALNLTGDFQIIQDRALFYATRKFYDPVLAAPTTTRSQLSSYQLLGTLLLPRRPSVAFLRRRPGDKTTAVSLGDHLDGWTVKAIQSGSVVFGYKIQRVTLTTTTPFGTTPAAEGLGIMRMRITQSTQRQASVVHATQAPTYPASHHP